MLEKTRRNLIKYERTSFPAIKEETVLVIQSEKDQNSKLLSFPASNKKNS